MTDGEPEALPALLNEALVALADQCKVPPDYHGILAGFDVSLFGCIAADSSALDEALKDLLEGAVEPPSTAQRLLLLSSLRLLYETCRQQSSASRQGKRQEENDITSGLSTSSWSEQFPPKLSGERVMSLQKQFHARYPGEILDPDNYPSARLLAYVAKVIQKGELRWIPWKLRMSQAQQDSLALRRPAKVPRLEELIYDDVPQREIPAGAVGANYLSGILGLVSVAVAMLQGAHLASLRKFERKFIKLATQKCEAGIRNPFAEEIMQADRQPWCQMADLVNLHGWSLDDALTEYTEIRGDMASLLQSRVAVPKKFDIPPGLRRLPGGKGKQKGGGKGRGANGGQSGQTGAKWITKFEDKGILPAPPSVLDLSKVRGNLFLDLFAGHARPLSSAFLQAGVSVLSVDTMLASEHDLLDDSVFEPLLRLSFSGAVTSAHASPPCREYSRCKLIRPGPKPLRTPEHLAGVPGLSSSEQERVDASRTLMERAVELLHATYKAGGHFSLENPANSMLWLEEAVRILLQKANADVLVVAACAYGWDISKRWAFATSFRDMQRLAKDCSHAEGSHRPVAGVRDESGGYASQQTSEFPAKLAEAYVSAALPLFSTCENPLDVQLSQLYQLIPAKGRFDMPFAHQDGAGIYSVPDWSFPPNGTVDRLQQVRHALTQKLFELKAPIRLREHVQAKSDSPLFSEGEIESFRAIFSEFLVATTGRPVDWSVQPFQPYTLKALQQLSEALEDPDDTLFACLQSGWQLSYRAGTVRVPQSKREKLRGLLNPLLVAGRVELKLIQQALGLLQWITQLHKELRPWLSSLYDDISRPPGTSFSIEPSRWGSLAPCLSDAMVFISTPAGAAIPVGSKLLSARHIELWKKSDLAKVPLTSKRVWMRIADPQSRFRRLSVLSRWDGVSPLPSPWNPDFRYRFTVADFFDLRHDVRLFPADAKLLWKLPR
ncbi:unnamed protein product [Symbiodinium sp. CCMP2592]|nr:unnamed protein product [Symbiodinium sp. CCMP2592]